MNYTSDVSLLEQLKTEENTSFKQLYSLYYQSIASYVLQNNGSSEDAEDIFQEAVIVLLQKVRQPDFVLTSSLKTYLYSIAKNSWLKRLRDNKTVSTLDADHLHLPGEVFSVELQDAPSREEKVGNWLSAITKHCQGVLKAIFYFQEPIDSLMQKMGWKNKHVAANQQYKCMQQLKKEKIKEENNNSPKRSMAL